MSKEEFQTVSDALSARLISAGSELSDRVPHVETRVLLPTDEGKAYLVFRRVRRESGSPWGLFVEAYGGSRHVAECSLWVKILVASALDNLLDAILANAKTQLEGSESAAAKVVAFTARLRAPHV